MRLTMLFALCLLIIPIITFFIGYRWRKPDNKRVPKVLAAACCVEIIWLVMYVSSSMTTLSTSAIHLILGVIVPIIGFFLAIKEIRRHPIFSALGVFISMLVGELAFFVVLISAM
ncbi:hypothetical protein [Pontibacillus yanchengensis]|uniref:Uncharacterized protein n=1 Tax=Pontibacillus yanchengensis Y32 TaxID=1385514 RepID=A0A0A2T8F9_9BACI|nr:hypothetical protein [Pontibacillus yanchengensis]KGP72107.1 hypothetical protein N782_14215 [Pontibacillus yanchengensis Y32]